MQDLWLVYSENILGWKKNDKAAGGGLHWSGLCNKIRLGGNCQTDLTAETGVCQRVLLELPPVVC